MYQQNLLLAEKFDNIEQVPFPGLDTKIHQQLKTLSLLFNNSCHQYEFGCDLKLMKTKERHLTFTNLIEHVEKHLLAAQNDVEDIKDQIYKTLKEKNDYGQTILSRQKRGPAKLAFGALTAVTAGAGIACSLGSICGSCGGTDQNREDIDFALTQIEENNKRWI